MQTQCVLITQCIYILQLSTGVQPKTDPLSFWGTTKDRSPILLGYNLRQIPFGRRFLFAHICRNSLFIICSLQNSSYCLLSTISGIFTINALLQQPYVLLELSAEIYAEFAGQRRSVRGMCIIRCRPNQLWQKLVFRVYIDHLLDH